MLFLSSHVLLKKLSPRFVIAALFPRTATNSGSWCWIGLCLSHPVHHVKFDTNEQSVLSHQQVWAKNYEILNILYKARLMWNAHLANLCPSASSRVPLSLNNCSICLSQRFCCSFGLMFYLKSHVPQGQWQGVCLSARGCLCGKTQKIPSG